MSEYELGVYRNHFYGHEFRIDEKDLNDVSTGLHYLGHISNSRHKSVASRLKQKQKQKRAKLRKKFKETSLKAFHDQWDLDLMVQLKWYEHYKISGKRTPVEGIRDSMRLYRDSDLGFRVGQDHFYTYYLLHGNRPNEVDGFIHATHYPQLNLDPTGTGSPRMLKWKVQTYDSKGNYLKTSFEEIKPTIKRNFSRTIMSIHSWNI